MDLGFFLRGLAIGFSIAAPVGPIGVLCIRRTLAEGRTSGFVSGLGAATADGLYGCVAGFGLTFLSNLLIQQQVWIRLIGGLFLCTLGLKTFLAPPRSGGCLCQSEGPCGSLCFDLRIDPHESHDDPCFCSHLCRTGSWKHGWELFCRRRIGARGLYRISDVVAFLERCGRSLQKKHQPDEHALDQ